MVPKLPQALILSPCDHPWELHLPSCCVPVLHMETLSFPSSLQFRGAPALRLALALPTVFTRFARGNWVLFALSMWGTLVMPCYPRTEVCDCHQEAATLVTANLSLVACAYNPSLGKLGREGGLQFFQGFFRLQCELVASRGCLNKALKHKWQKHIKCLEYSKKKKSKESPFYNVWPRRKPAENRCGTRMWLGGRRNNVKYFGKLAIKYEKPFKNIKTKTVSILLDQLLHIFKSPFPSRHI